jgi:uncharacterized protein DUF1566
MRVTAFVAAALLAAVACASPRFVASSDAVVRDSRTGLEWTRRDDGHGLDWHAAEAYCRGLDLDGGGWRLPEIDELHALYGATARRPCGDAQCAVDAAFTLTSPWVWSATVRDATTRGYLDFQSGNRFFPGITPQLLRRVLCVRARHGAG